MKNLEVFDISIEEFDEMNDTHIFSKHYTQNKKRMIKDYKKRQLAGKRTLHLKVAAASVVALVSTPLIANAAMGGELFNRIWGNEGKRNIESHEDTIYEEEKDTSYTVTYPEREYVDVDAEKAEKLIGSYIVYPNITKEINDGTTLTVESVVRDKNAAVVCFTLENENGVDALNYSQLDNEAKGAWFSEDAPFYFKIGNGNGKIYVDLEKSTETLLYCYDYMSIKGSLDIELYENPRNEAGEWDLEQADKTTIRMPHPEKIPSTEYVNADGGIISISPLSMTIDLYTGLGLSWESANNPGSCYYVEIKYTDGTKYTVWENDTAGHRCDVLIDNTGYSCGGLECDVTKVFNRLVDVNEVESIIVNETEYFIK